MGRLRLAEHLSSTELRALISSKLEQSPISVIYVCMSYIHTYIHAYIHRYIHTYIHTYIVHMCRGCSWAVHSYEQPRRTGARPTTRRSPAPPSTHSSSTPKSCGAVVSDTGPGKRRKQTPLKEA